MCKMHGGKDVEAGGLDVSKGREILPANVIPRHYDLTLEPDFKKLTYDGTVIIDLDVVEDSNSISLNTLELDIHSTKVLSGSQTIRLVIKLNWIIFSNSLFTSLILETALRLISLTMS
jgi:aminopeptidase 2